MEMVLMGRDGFDVVEMIFSLFSLSYSSLSFSPSFYFLLSFCLFLFFFSSFLLFLYFLKFYRRR